MKTNGREFRPELFERLQRRFATHKEAAKALGIPVRTFFDWRERGLLKSKWVRVEKLIGAVLKEENL